MKRISFNLLLLFLFTANHDSALAQRREGSRAAGQHYGNKLAETDLYELYMLSSCLNTQNPYRATINLVFNVDANYVITDDAAYKRRFEEEILPIIKKQCPAVNDININNYIKGVRIRYWDGKEFNYNDTTFNPKDEHPLTVMWVSINKQGEARLVDQYRTRSLSEHRKRHQRIEAEETSSRDPEAERFAKMEYTSDGKLKLTGLEHKKLFQQIYDAEFTQMLAEDVSDSYLPYLMFSGHISVYADMCRSSLSPSAVGVDIYGERYLRTEYSAFRRTEYYERYLAKTVYMEPKYEVAYRLSVATSLAKIYESWRRRPGDIGIPAYFIMASTRALPLLFDSRQLISNNGCGSQSNIRFMDNLHKYVTGNWSTVTADGYKYIEKENPNLTRRYYAKVPATFSPKFPVPSKEQVTYYLNESGSEGGYGYENENPGLKSITIARFGFGWNKQVEDLRKLTSVPQYVWDARDAKKYYVATCEYLVGGGSVSIHYWNANGPLPPAAVQEFVKGVIREPRTECPTAYPGR